jgi:hypothetical protein
VVSQGSQALNTETLDISSDHCGNFKTEALDIPFGNQKLWIC